jgi:hypothetical protein
MSRKPKFFKTEPKFQKTECPALDDVATREINAGEQGEDDIGFKARVETEGVEERLLNTLYASTSTF